MSTSIGISDGSYASIIERFTKDHSGHIQIHARGYLDKSSIYKTIPNLPKLKSALDKTRNVVAQSPRVRAAGLAYAHSKSLPCQIYGIDSARETATTLLGKKILKGKLFESLPDSQGRVQALVGAQIADQLRLHPGESLALISQAADGSVANDLFIVSGIVGTSDSYESQNIYLPLSAAQTFFALEGKVHEWVLQLSSFRNAKPVARQLQGQLGDSFDVDPWQRVEEEFYRTMKADEAGNYTSLAIIMIMVGIGVLNAVLMSILERTREYGILKALGTRPRYLFGLIVTEVFSLAVISSLVGVVIGTLSNSWFATYGITLSHPIDIGGVPFTKILGDLSIRSLVLPGVITLGTALLVSVFPAWRASRLDPIASIRTP